jgi:hypothetical protein
MDDLQWLIGGEAAAVLARLAASGDSLVRHTRALRAELSPRRAHLVLELAELRRRGREKFSRADVMFFHRVGLEQATDERIAAYKAGRFPAAAPVADLCCGIGGDLAALAARGPALGVDRDGAAALFASANCRALEVMDRRASNAPEQPPQAPRIPASRGSAWRVGCGGGNQRAVEVRAAEVEVDHARGCRAWHIDPDRRPQGRRVARPELCEPGPDFIDAVRAELPHGAVKLAPSAEPPAPWIEGEREWIGHAGQCQQQVAWFGDLARHAGGRVATILPAGGEPCSFRGPANPPPLPVEEGVRRFVYEPHAAVLAAGLAGSLAAELGLAAYLPGVPYLTSDRQVGGPLVAAFRVLEVLPFDTRRIKGVLRKRGIGRLEVKKRGVDLDPAIVRARLSVPGEKAAVLLVARSRSSPIAVLAERVGE